MRRKSAPQQIANSINAEKVVLIHEAIFSSLNLESDESSARTVCVGALELRKQEVCVVSAKLSNAIARRANLAEIGKPITSIDDEIRRLKQDLLHGGQLDIGYPLNDRFVLTQEVGAGGFAKVWRAQDRSNTNSEVVIKVLHPIFTNDILRRERFFRGARAMKSLAHPRVVEILKTQNMDSGFHYFVMEYIADGNLAEAVASRTIKPRNTIEILNQILEILADAHSKGFVHQDVKPSNVMVTGQCKIKLTDFVLVIAPNTTGGTLGGIIGTFGYASPEQFTNPDDANARSDVFAAARTALYLLNGAELTNTQSWQIYSRPEEIVDTIVSDAKLAHMLSKALNRSPSKRFLNAAEFLEPVENRNSITVRKRKGKIPSQPPDRTHDARTTSGQKKRFPLPRPTRKQIQEAMETFDDKFRETTTWMGFQKSKSHKYAVKYNSQLCPVKMLLHSPGGEVGETCAERLVSIGTLSYR
jgi:serine/threonine protein kinase